MSYQQLGCILEDPVVMYHYNALRAWLASRCTRNDPALHPASIVTAHTIRHRWWARRCRVVRVNPECAYSSARVVAVERIHFAVYKHPTGRCNIYYVSSLCKLRGDQAMLLLFE